MKQVEERNKSFTAKDPDIVGGSDIKGNGVSKGTTTNRKRNYTHIAVLAVIVAVAVLMIIC